MTDNKISNTNNIIIKKKNNLFIIHLLKFMQDLTIKIDMDISDRI